MSVIPYKTHTPQIEKDVFIAPDAWVIGKVHLHSAVSIFFGTVLRGDIKKIHIGERTNIQEHATIHTSTNLQDCTVGKNVTIGHAALIHGCTIEDNCIIGMSSTILDGAHIGSNSIIGAQALVSMNTIIPPKSLVLGVPAKVVRSLNQEEIKQIEESATHYVELGKYYREYFAAQVGA